MQLDDFLGPLSNGQKEVVVSKSELEGPPGPGWTKSRVCLPKPGVIANYRKGSIHAQEFADEFRVHRDKYDPKKNGLMHVIGDAPLLLMLWDAMRALMKGAATNAKSQTKSVLAALRRAHRSRMMISFLLLLLGISMILFPVEDAWILFKMIIPLVAVAVGALAIFLALFGRKARIFGARSGALMVGLGWGLMTFLQYEAFLITVFLSTWLVASGVHSFGECLRSFWRGRNARHGLLRIGALSLVMGVSILLVPASVIMSLTPVVGVIIVLLAIGSMIMTSLGLLYIGKEMRSDNGT